MRYTDGGDFAALIGQRIRSKRKDLRLTGVDLADRIDSYPSMVSMMETGSRCPKVYLIWRLARALGCSIDELITGNPWPIWYNELG